MAFTRRRRIFGSRSQKHYSNGSGNNFGGGRGQNKIRYMRVDPLMLIKKAQPQLISEYDSKNSFADFNLDTIIYKNLTHKGYKSPTPIQDRVIGEIMAGGDVLGLAATGTGKTAAFLLPIIHKLINNRDQRAIIITPTRELAVQIIDEIKAFTFGSRCYFTLIIGGVDIRRQIRELARNPQIVVGTPGRIKDLTDRGGLKLEQYQTIVLDEVDRMLDMGFIGEITRLIGKLPRVRQSLFFSATMSDKARQIASRFLLNPVTVQVETQRASDNVDQDVVRVANRNKIDVLRELLTKPGFDKVLVFGRTKRGMDRLSRNLFEKGFKTAAIHGNKSQSQRQRALDAFKNNRVQVLVATDVAARGIDIDDVTHVINYELPETYDDYIHRIGRTGRADKTGVALTFID